jgi:GNAT superfamily N-acetyltransferase
LTVANLPVLVARNLLRTYFALGKASPGAVISRGAGFELCSGAFDHPICNFAANLTLDPWAANRLVEIAIARQHFNVYSLPGDQPASRDVREEILLRAGFRRVYSLRQMVCQKAPSVGGCELVLAEGQAERFQVASFMAAQFFGRHSSSFRRRVADATAGALELDLYSVSMRDGPTAAVMVSEDTDIFGLFNLCVKPGNQNRGIGASLVSAVQEMAYGKGKPVGLQCEEALVSWYENLGFVANGFVDVYNLPEDRRIDIMD